MRAPLSTAALLPLLVAACGGDAAYMIVTVEARPAVHDATTLKVTLSNNSSAVSEDFALDQAFPVTFSVSAEGRTGELGISVDALDEAGALVGRGAGQSTIAAETASVTLDSVDFVVNTDFVDDQEVSGFAGEHGFQLAAIADGTWTTVWRAPCVTPCNVFGRRFDPAGRAVTSQLAASTNAFPVSTKLTTGFSTAAVAASATTTIAVWNASTAPPVTPTVYSIECRSINASGAAASNQIQVAVDTFPNLVSATALSNSNFAVAWDGEVSGVDTIRAVVVKPDCANLSPPVAVSTVAGLVRNSTVTTSADRILYAWILDGNVRARIATNANGFLTADSQLVAKTATEEVEYVRIAPLPGGGFAIFARWALIAGATGPGRIEMFRVNSAGVLVGSPVLVTDRSGSDFNSKQSFGVAARPDGSMLVVWHACEERGDASGCGVFGRVVDAAGAAIGETFDLATTKANDQIGPSVVALPGTPAAFATVWTDSSGEAPDRSGAAVRGRIVYPALGTN